MNVPVGFDLYTMYLLRSYRKITKANARQGGDRVAERRDAAGRRSRSRVRAPRPVYPPPVVGTTESAPITAAAASVSVRSVAEWRARAVFVCAMVSASTTGANRS